MQIIRLKTKEFLLDGQSLPGRNIDSDLTKLLAVTEQ